MIKLQCLSEKVSEEKYGYVPDNDDTDVYIFYTGPKCKTTVNEITIFTSPSLAQEFINSTHTSGEMSALEQSLNLIFKKGNPYRYNNVLNNTTMTLITYTTAL